MPTLGHSKSGWSAGFAAALALAGAGLAELNSAESDGAGVLRGEEDEQPERIAPSTAASAAGAQSPAHD